MNIFGVSFGSRFFSLSVCWLLCVGFAFPLCAAEIRTWSDSTGKFKIDARFDSCKDGTVFLKKSDGSPLQIPLDKLSTADQDYIKEQASAAAGSPFKTNETNPFQTPGSSGASGSSSTAPAATAVANPSKLMLENRVVEANWQSATPMSLMMAGSWTPIPAQVAPAPTITNPKAFRIPPKSSFFEEVTNRIVNSQAGFATIGYKCEEPGSKEAAYSRLVLCNLKQGGRVTKQATVPGQFALLDVDDSGTLALVRTDEFGHGKSNMAEIWSLGGKEVERGMQWTPFSQDDMQNLNQPGSGGAKGFGAKGFGDQESGNRGFQGFGSKGFGNRTAGNRGFGHGFPGNGEADDITWGKFLSNNRALLCSSSGMVSAWDLSDCSVLWYFETGGFGRNSCSLALSPDQRYAAFATRELVGVVDIQKGESVASMAAPQKFSGMDAALAFSPSMKCLAASTGTHLYIWTLADGKLIREMEYIGRSHVQNETLAWVNDQYVLVGGACLVDAANLIQVWKFEGGAGTVSGGYVWFLCGASDMMGFIPVKLPHPKMIETMKQATKDPDFFILKPGTVVRIDVSGVKTNPGEVETILTKKLEEKGFKVGSNGTIDLVASQCLGKREKHGYGRHFGFRSDMEFDIQSYLSDLKFVYQGKEVWKRSHDSVPGSLNVSKDESFEQKVRASEKYTNTLYEKTELPGKLMKSESGSSIGTSKVTPNGIL